MARRAGRAGAAAVNPLLAEQRPVRHPVAVLDAVRASRYVFAFLHLRRLVLLSSALIGVLTDAILKTLHSAVAPF
jgi:hypothetical protein